MSTHSMSHSLFCCHLSVTLLLHALLMQYLKETYQQTTVSQQKGIEAIEQSTQKKKTFEKVSLVPKIIFSKILSVNVPQESFKPTNHILPCECGNVINEPYVWLAV